MTQQPPARAPRIAPTVDPSELRDMIEELSALPEDEYTRALGRNLTDEDPVETAAFRSPELVQRTAIAARMLIEQTTTTIKRREGESTGQWKHRATQFRILAQRERHVCTVIVDGLRAQRGILPNSPSPRARAARRLQRAHPEEFLRYVREAREEIREENRRKKEEQKRLRAEQRRARR